MVGFLGKLYLSSSFFPTKPDQSTQKTDQSCDLLKVKFFYANLVGPNLVMEYDRRMFYSDCLLMAFCSATASKFVRNNLNVVRNAFAALTKQKPHEAR